MGRNLLKIKIVSFREVCRIYSKPPGYAAISAVLWIIFMKRSPFVGPDSFLCSRPLVNWEFGYGAIGGQVKYTTIAGVVQPFYYLLRWVRATAFEISRKGYQEGGVDSRRRQNAFLDTDSAAKVSISVERQSSFAQNIPVEGEHIFTGPGSVLVEDDIQTPMQLFPYGPVLA